MKVLVSGGRKFKDYKYLCKILDELHKEYNFTFLVNGGAKGVDKLSSVWAKTRKIPFVEVPADWDSHGLAAGQIRNQKMLDTYAPDVVVFFPGGVGTNDMFRRSITARVGYIEDYRRKEI